MYRNPSKLSATRLHLETPYTCISIVIVYSQKSLRANARAISLYLRRPRPPPTHDLRRTAHFPTPKVSQVQELQMYTSSIAAVVFSSSKILAAYARLVQLTSSRFVFVTLRIASSRLLRNVIFEQITHMDS